MTKLKIILIIIFIISIITAAVLPIAKAIFWDKAGKVAQITIEAGQSTRQIGENLKNEKVISSAWVFAAMVYANRWYLQTGVYKITPEMNMFDIAGLLHSGKVEEYLVTIPEGWRVTQIDEELAKKGMIKKGEFTEIASANEGYLFPDTYRFPLDTTADKIKILMLENFKKKTADFQIIKQAVILASIVEREAKTDEERPKIAAVYLNRLKIGMKLDADPTIQYGKGDWGNITSADYKNFVHPYNTYLNAGLPPGPICNPGLKSIQAALFPDKHDYFYFFHTPDGSIVFSKTLEEHQAKVKGE